RRGNLEGEVVHVAPVPVLTRFERLDDRVGGLVKVACRVSAGRVVATADVSALGAAAQVNPMTAGAEALDTAVAARRDVEDLIQVGTSLGHAPGVADPSGGWVPAGEEAC